ncbi:hypothetical protein BD414DRAFT_529720 [Trametes punicea]|nr:hypothetical protein BD414DRAFT_529720 [Trametes punicea]
MEQSPATQTGLATERGFYVLKGRAYSHFDQLELSSETENYLEALVDIADALGIDDLSFSTYSEAIERLDAEELTVVRSLLRTREAEDELSQQLLTAVHEKTLIKNWMKELHTTSLGTERVAALQRQKATLTSKAKEYQKELETTLMDMPEAPPVSITEFISLRKQLKKQEQMLKEKRARVEAFQGLPPNIELAKHALAEARDKQMELIQLRERLLSKMVDEVN